MRRIEAVATGLTIGCALAGCDIAKKEGAKERADQVEVAQEALKRAQREECAKLRTQPDALLATSELQYRDKGIINDYRQLIAVTVLNKARYCAVATAEGDVTWLDAQDQRLGSTPFALRTSIPAGGTQRFSVADGTMTSGTLQGDGKRAKIAFARVVVIDPS